jgi:hypothetical protein
MKSFLKIVGIWIIVGSNLLECNGPTHELPLNENQLILWQALKQSSIVANNKAAWFCKGKDNEENEYRLCRNPLTGTRHIIMCLKELSTPFKKEEKLPGVKMRIYTNEDTKMARKFVNYGLGAASAAATVVGVAAGWPSMPAVGFCLAAGAATIKFNEYLIKKQDTEKPQHYMNISISSSAWEKLTDSK